MKKNVIVWLSLIAVVFSLTTIISCGKNNGEEPYREYEDDEPFGVYVEEEISPEG